MRRIIVSCVVFAIAANILLSGCAPAYHAYPNGCVTYGYRTAAPPPFTFYRGCATPWSRRYASESSSPAIEGAATSSEHSSRRL